MMKGSKCPGMVESACIYRHVSSAFSPRPISVVPLFPSYGVFPPPYQSWKDGPEPSTPHYSQGILQEGSFKQHLAVLHSWLGRECTGVKQAVVLLKVRTM